MRTSGNGNHIEQLWYDYNSAIRLFSYVFGCQTMPILLGSLGRHLSLRTFGVLLVWILVIVFVN